MDPEYTNFLILAMAGRRTGVPPEFLRELEEQGEEDEDEEYEEEEEEEDEDGDEDEDEDYEEEEGEDEGGGEGSGTTLRQVLYGDIGNNVNLEVVNLETQDSDNAADDVMEMGAPGTSSSEKMEENDVSKTGGITGEENKEELNLGEIDGLICPICFEAWSSGGDHHVCCLPCGHIYGLSCIKKWLRRPRSSKCPQCKKKCGMKDIRLLYTSQIVAVDGELQRTVRMLEDKCAMLEKKNADWSKKEIEWKKREADMLKQVRNLEEMKHNLEGLIEDMENRISGSSPTNSNCRGSSAFDCDAFPQFHTQGCLNKFLLQKEFQVDGARLFDFDSCSQMFVVARRLSGMGGAHVLTKVSLLFDHEKHDVRLPENIRVIKDLRVCPHAKIVLLASLGKKLSVLSTESNNTILTYDLPAAGWSCSWDVGSSHYVYTGLQNGTVLQFDMRSTRGYVQSMNGFSSNPVHTLHSLSSDSSLHSGVRSVLSASSLGLCQWNFGGSEERPYLIPESDKQGVCISLAHCRSSDDIVASYRPKLETPTDTDITQPTLAPLGQVAQGSHIHYKKIGCTYQKLSARCANVSDIRLPKSAIIDGVYPNPVFVSADEVTHELMLQELPSLMPVEYLKPKGPPTRDIKYACHLNSGLLSCLSENSLRLFTAKLL